MTVHIKSNRDAVYPQQAKDLQDGQAYERSDGTIFIGNAVAMGIPASPHTDIMAFSLDGHEVVMRGNQDSRFRKITLIVEVQENE